MDYLGDFSYGATIYVPFHTFDSNGASITLTGLAATDIEIYKNGGTTQRASDNGYTLLDTDGIDFDGITGIHGFSIDTSDNSTAGFFGPGNDYFVVIASVTVDTRTVNFVRSFSIENRHTAGLLVRTTIATLASQTSFTLTAGSADNDAYNGCEIVIQDVGSTVQKAVGVVLDYTGSTKTVTLLADPAVFTMATTDYVSIYADRAVKPTVDNRTLDVSSGGEAGVDWANVGSPTASNSLSNTIISASQGVASVSGNVTGSVGSLGSTARIQVNDEVSDVVLSSGLAMAADLEVVDNFLDTEIAAIKAKTDQLTFTTPNQVNATTVTNSDKTGYALTADFRIKKNTALANFMFVMVDSTDHITPKTGLTITAQRSLDGAAFGSCANSASELSNGVYTLSLAATDLNADVVTLRFTASGADDRLLTVITQQE